MSASRKSSVVCKLFLDMFAFIIKCNTYNACFCFGLSTRTPISEHGSGYLSVTEAPHNTEFYECMGRNIFLSFKPLRLGNEPRTLA